MQSRTERTIPGSLSLALAASTLLAGAACSHAKPTDDEALLGSIRAVTGG